MSVTKVTNYKAVVCLWHFVSSPRSQYEQLEQDSFMRNF